MAETPENRKKQNFNKNEIRDDQAAPMARLGAHEAVENILKDLPRGLLLDVPAGQGALAARLKRLGFEVFCCDLYPEIFKLGDTDI